MDGIFGKIDLHMHTTASDGTDSPEELVEKVRLAGIELFSVTDHDAIGSAEVIPGLLGEGDPAFIVGVEFSCRIGEGDAAEKYHILGYGFDPSSEDIRSLLEKTHRFRMEKAVKRLDFLRSEFDIKFSPEEEEAFLALNSPAKPHLANMMVSHGYAKDIDDAVENYIDKRQFENVNPRPEEAIECIIASGGIPVLAHPPFGDGGDHVEGAELERRIKYLKETGLQGLEGFYHKYTDAQRAEVLGLAERYDLYVTAGSDYHGTNKPVALGDNKLENAAEGPAGLLAFLRAVRRA